MEINKFKIFLIFLLGVGVGLVMGFSWGFKSAINAGMDVLNNTDAETLISAIQKLKDWGIMN